MRGARLRTDHRLWAIVALGLFVALGFVDPLAGATWKGEHSFWYLVGTVVLGEWTSGLSGALLLLLFYAGLLCVPSVLLGWVVQAVVVLIRATASGAIVPEETLKPGGRPAR
jgi:MFS superfamily sulfate permease-like transporter